MIIIMLMIINLIYIAQFDTNSILTALYIVMKYKQMHYMHLLINMNKHSYTDTGILIYTYLRTYTHIDMLSSILKLRFS